VIASALLLVDTQRRIASGEWLPDHRQGCGIARLHLMVHPAVIGGVLGNVVPSRFWRARLASQEGLGASHALPRHLPADDGALVELGPPIACADRRRSALPHAAGPQPQAAAACLRG
jgi:hypothetical protein